MWAAEYMEQKLGIPQSKISHMCLEYYTTYGTTMAGLRPDWHTPSSKPAACVTSDAPMVPLILPSEHQSDGRMLVSMQGWSRMATRSTLTTGMRMCMARSPMRSC